METPWKNGAPSALPDSLWACVTPKLAEHPRLETNRRADVAIIGGGFMGLAAALKLAETGARIALIEASEIGWGASGRNAGQVIPGLKRDPHEVRRILGSERGERLLRVSGDAPRLIFELISRYGIRCDAINKGWIQAAHSCVVLPAIERRVSDWQELGAEVELIPAASVSRRLGTDFYRGAWYDPRGGSLNPLAFVRGLAAAAAAAGANIYTQTHATRVQRSGERWIIHTPGGELSCESVLLCTNAYGNGLKQSRATVIPLRTGQVATEPMQDDQLESILPGGEAASDTQRLLTSFRITADRRLVMGGASATAGDQNTGLIRHLHLAAKMRFPHIGPLHWRYGWSGYLALTGDHLPAIHRFERGLYGGIGCNGRGIAMATATGFLLAELLISGDETECPIPVQKAHRLPTFGLRYPGVALAVIAKRVLDSLERKLRFSKGLSSGQKRP